MSSIKNGKEALERCLRLENVSTVLDVGAGSGLHSQEFFRAGKKVTTVDLLDGADYMETKLGKFDLVWCCHVLEHQLNVNAFLKKIALNTKIDGYICITVPPSKPNIVGGHLTIWNAGLLLYNMIVAGIDCKYAVVKEYDYNISVIVKYNPIEMPKLKMDKGDIETLKDFFPFAAEHGFDGRINEVNW